MGYPLLPGKVSGPCRCRRGLAVRMRASAEVLHGPSGETSSDRPPFSWIAACTWSRTHGGCALSTAPEDDWVQNGDPVIIWSWPAA